MLLKPVSVLPKNRDKNNLAVPDNGRLSPTVNPADELRQIVKLWMSIHVEHVQVFQGNPALLQGQDQSTLPLMRGNPQAPDEQGHGNEE